MIEFKKAAKDPFFSLLVEGRLRVKSENQISSGLESVLSTSKDRYIKMIDGINAEELSKLEDIFHYDKDKELIREIRKQVEEFEMENLEQIIELEQTPALQELSKAGRGWCGYVTWLIGICRKLSAAGADMSSAPLSRGFVIT